jgi:hypothetical protein
LLFFYKIGRDDVCPVCFERFRHGAHGKCAKHMREEHELVDALRAGYGGMYVREDFATAVTTTTTRYLIRRSFPLSRAPAGKTFSCLDGVEMASLSSLGIELSVSIVRRWTQMLQNLLASDEYAHVNKYLHVAFYEFTWQTVQDADFQEMERNAFDPNKKYNMLVTRYTGFKGGAHCYLLIFEKGRRTMHVIENHFSEEAARTNEHPFLLFPMSMIRDTLGEFEERDSYQAGCDPILGWKYFRNFVQYDLVDCGANTILNARSFVEALFKKIPSPLRNRKSKEATFHMEFRAMDGVEWRRAKRWAVALMLAQGRLFPTACVV